MTPGAHPKVTGKLTPKVRKIPAPVKMKSPPPQKKTQIPPPKTRNFLDMEVFLQKEGKIPGVHKIGAPISGPRIADKNFTDTRIFSEKVTF